jgi:hypothetical protein
MKKKFAKHLALIIIPLILFVSVVIYISHTPNYDDLSPANMDYLTQGKSQPIELNPKNIFGFGLTYYTHLIETSSRYVQTDPPIIFRKNIRTLQQHQKNEIVNIMSISPEIIASLPKSDLHCHLDGSMRVSTLIELAQEQGLKLPSYEVDGLNELVFKKEYASLSEYLLGFRYTCAALHSFDAIERAAFELAEDVLKDGVRYLEVRFAPQLLVNSGTDCVQTFISVNQGVSRAAGEFNRSAAVKSGEDIPFEYGITSSSNFGEYSSIHFGHTSSNTNRFKKFVSSTKYSSQRIHLIAHYFFYS